MTSIARLSISWQIDDMAATDVANINPHFHVAGGPVFAPADWQQLTDDLGAALDTWSQLHNQITVKAYDAEGAPPHYPLATTVKRAGVAGASNVNRDLALCLSYYADVNQPRKRGRLYIPCFICGVSGAAAFASAANMNTIAGLVPIFTGLGGINVDWVVWSRVDHVARPVTNWYVDNNWDTQRRRGPKPTARQSGTTTEAALPNFAGFSPADGLMLSEAAKLLEDQGAGDELAPAASEAVQVAAGG
jgi:hypothetical protein